MVEVVGRMFDHASSLVIVVQWVAPGVMVVIAFYKRHPLIHHGRKFFRKEDDE